MGKFYIHRQNNQDLLEESANHGPLLNQSDQYDSSQQQQKSLDSESGSTLMSNRQTTKREHTVPDVVTSCLHKPIKKLVKPNKELKKFFSQLTKKYNKGSFSKLMIIAKKAGVSNKIKQQFIKSYASRIESKSKKWTSKRLEEANKIYQQYLKAFDAKTVRGQLCKIWDGRTKDPRFARCLNEVTKFQKQLNNKSKQLFKQ